MIKIERIKTSGWQAAIRGMRNPLESWDKSDSKFLTYTDDGFGVDYEDIMCNYHNMDETDWYDLWEQYGYGDMIIGPNDLKLMMNLAKSGPEHAKFLRDIHVSFDVIAPLYWWKEFDTYKVGTTANSCSTMHTIHKKVFTLDDFSCEHLGYYDADKEQYEIVEPVLWNNNEFNSTDGLQETIDFLNEYRKRFLATQDKRYWWQLIQLLPSSYNQRRTIDTNYAALANMYKQRRNHKLDEWHAFCKMVDKGLPYSQIITLKEEDKLSDNGQTNL